MVDLDFPLINQNDKPRSRQVKKEGDGMERWSILKVIYEEVRADKLNTEEIHNFLEALRQGTKKP